MADGCEPRAQAGAQRIPGLAWRRVAAVADVAAALEDGARQRATSATAMNAASSRSHAVLSVRVGAPSGCASLLHLVDLAGEPQQAALTPLGQRCPIPIFLRSSTKKKKKNLVFLAAHA